MSLPDPSSLYGPGAGARWWRSTLAGLTILVVGLLLGLHAFDGGGPSKHGAVHQLTVEPPPAIAAGGSQLPTPTPSGGGTTATGGAGGVGGTPAPAVAFGPTAALAGAGSQSGGGSGGGSGSAPANNNPAPVVGAPAGGTQLPIGTLGAAGLALVALLAFTGRLAWRRLTRHRRLVAAL